MALSIGVLGPLVIERDDCRLGKVPKKARALLGYLAAQGGQAVSRERLADLLWPYQGSEQARHSLRNCLLELRKALGPSGARHLVADFANCRIQDAVVDLDRFERLSRSRNRPELQAAAELYRGEFLADFDIDSEPFQEWLAAERDRTLARICDILQRLIAAQDAAGEADAAIQSGRRLVALAPLSEFGQRALMRAYGRAGRRGEALRQYKSCAEILKRELGVAPDAETQALAHEMARSGNTTEADPRSGVAEGPGFSPGGSIAGRGASERAVRGERLAVTASGSARLTWPCLLSSIGVAVAPLRNLTGDPEQQYLVEAFTEDLVTDLLRHGRGLSLKPIADERGILGSLPGEAERGFEYVVTGSAQRSSPGMFGSTCGSPTRQPPSICGPVGMNSDPKTSPRSRPRSPGGSPASFTCCSCKRPAAAPRSPPMPSSGSMSVWPALRRPSRGSCGPNSAPRPSNGFLPCWRATRAMSRRWSVWRAPASIWSAIPGGAIRGPPLRHPISVARRLPSPWRSLRGTPLPNAPKGCCARPPGSWRRPPTPSSKPWRWITASGWFTALPGTMPPCSVAPARHCRRSSALCAWIRPIAGTASGSSSADLPSCCSGASKLQSSSSANHWNAIPATAAPSSF